MCSQNFSIALSKICPVINMKYVFSISIILWLTACESKSQPASSNLTPEQFNTEFFNLYKSKGNEPSLKYIFSTNKWISDNDFNTVKNKLNELTMQLGKYHGNELITKKSIGQNLILYSYLIKYERQPIRFMMTYYKADKKWQLQIFEFDYDLQNELREAATSYRLIENLPGN
jgi:hypothetical protein